MAKFIIFFVICCSLTCDAMDDVAGSLLNYLLMSAIESPRALLSSGSSNGSLMCDSWLLNLLPFDLLVSTFFWLGFCTRPNPDPCDPNPCQHGAMCIPTANNEDYNCACPEPTTGRNCEGLDCKDALCFRLNATVYYLYLRSSTEKAYDGHKWCHQRQQDMVMLKDHSTDHAVRHKLIELYAGHEDLFHALWIGLRKEEGEWTWLDGTELGSYEGWIPGEPGNKACAHISNGAAFPWYWDDVDCYGKPGWTYFPFCHKTYDIYAMNACAMKNSG